MLAFNYVKANSKEIREEISFPLFFRRILTSAIEIQGYLKKCVATANFSSWIAIGLANLDLVFPRGPPDLPQRPLYLVSTVLNCIDVDLHSFSRNWKSETTKLSSIPGGILPYMGYIGMCGPKGYSF